MPPKRPEPIRRRPVASSDYLMQLTLYDGGRVIIDKRRLSEVLLVGIEYEALVAVTEGTHELLGSLMTLLAEARLSTVDRLPVMAQPGRTQ